MTPPRGSTRLGGAVIAWTTFTTVFLWTPTMRGLFRPDISTWSVLGVQGAGNAGSFWVFPTLAAIALLTFWLYGRDRLRPVYRTLLLAWHGLLVFVVVAGVVGDGGAGSFEGGVWGVRIPLAALVVPFAAFFLLTIAWIAAEWRSPPRGRAPTPLDRRALGLALLLLPVAIVLFRIGDGIDWPTRLGTATTVLQWVLLTQAMANDGPVRP